jgi:16S rRNA U516 pseudouridylate synthase RsuA-like enzyme|tara:strand:- start:868 stop:1074 length:207 start_codon:yes stop_codon:yes gene_type:complete
MDEDNLNIEIRKFLKQVGISSQREIENYIRKQFSDGNIKVGDSIKVSMNLSSEDGELSHSINETLKIK